LLGWSVGALSGYFLPALIHYGWSNTHGLHVTPLATLSGSFGLNMIGKLD
jgi:hypothetical protein